MKKISSLLIHTETGFALFCFFNTTVHNLVLYYYILTQVSPFLTWGDLEVSELEVLYVAAHPSSYSGCSPKKMLKKTQLNISADKEVALENREGRVK